MKNSLVLATGVCLLTLSCHHTVQPAIQSDLSRKVTEGEIIEAIDVRGNIQIPNEKIRPGLHSKLGERVSLPAIQSDIEFLYSLGFEEVRVEEEPGRYGKTVVFHVKEKTQPKKQVPLRL